MPRLTFTAGEILTAANLNVVSDQSVMTFADATARDTAIPSPSEGMVVYLASTKNLQRWNGAAWVNVVSGFTARETITASNASWPVPSLASPIVKVTVIGGGGGGGAADGSSGGTGGTTTFNAGGAGTVTATGGAGGSRAASGVNVAGAAGSAGSASGNGGGAGTQDRTVTAVPGRGGLVTVAYLDLTGVSTVDVTIGAGGAAGSGGTGGGAGGRGEVIVEYVGA